MSKRHKKNLRKNPAALLASLILVISAFLFQLTSLNFLGTNLGDKGVVMFNVIQSMIKNGLGSTEQSILASALAILFIIVFLLYTLNGLGLIRNRYSRYASYLTFAYLIIGLYVINRLNRELSVPIFGNMMGSISLGVGIYIVPIVGILYFIFRRYINQAVHL